MSPANVVPSPGGNAPSVVDYTAGDHYLVVVGQRVAVTSDASLAAALWLEFAAAKPTDDVLDTLLRTGLGSLADLVLLDAAGSTLRLLLRGPGQIRLQHPAGRVEVVSAAGVTTWVDRVVTLPESVRVGPIGDAEPALPLGLGVVRAGGLRWSTAGAGGSGVGTALIEAVPAVGVPAVVVPIDEVQVDPVPVEAVPVEAVPNPPAASGAALGETRAEPAESRFDHLFESTVMRSVEDAAIRESEAGQSESGSIGAGPTGARPGDHDGSTIMRADLAVYRQAAPPREAAVGTSTVARLLLSTGEVIEVLDNAGVVIGRRPQVDRVAGAALPLMVTVPSPNSDISRSHLRLDAVDGRVRATDLRSTNGTVLTEVDGTATHLVAGDARAVHPGDVLAVGDGITITVLEPV
jgi:hypothetical protein